MKRKEINKILNDENGVVLIQKQSEHSFSDTLLIHSNSIFSLLFFWRIKKDYLIITSKRLVLIYRNKVKHEFKINKLHSLEYNGSRSSLEIEDIDGKRSIVLTRFRISYEEGKQVRQNIVRYLSQLTIDAETS